MKTLKKVLIVIAILIAIPLIIALFIDKKFQVEREIIIDKPEAEVYNYIKFLKNQDNFSTWAKMDPAMKKSFTGTDGTIGFTSAWESSNDEVGRGHQTITGLSENERIDVDLVFLEPYESHARAYMTTESITSSQTKVKWGFNSEMPYPMNFMSVVMDMDEMIGKDLSTGLSNLKSILEG